MIRFSHRRLRDSWFFFDECDECGIFSEAIARSADHSRPHDFVRKGVFLKAASYFATVASETKAAANEQTIK